MTKPTATIITDGPIVVPMAQMQLIPEGVMKMAEWVRQYRPQCVPEKGFQNILDLVPHDGVDHVICPMSRGGMCDVSCPSCHGEVWTTRQVTDNELLAELAGRKCYDSFADAGAKRTNGEYLRSMWEGRIPHRSTGYHAKMTFFFAHISRRVSHELIRNYVGSDRDEEGSPSQESTRFTHHPGVYIAHPYLLENDGVGDFDLLDQFRRRAQANYEDYVYTINLKARFYENKHGKKPVGLDKKRIYESTSGDLLMSCGTSFVWTTNPMALTKFFHERDDEAADMEMCRFAREVKRVAIEMAPNLFPDFVQKR
jgi:thymidylate synthase ThyX